MAPYFVAWRSHHRDEPLRRAVADRFPAARLLRERSGRTVWFRDALDGERDGFRCIVSHSLAVDLAIEIAGGADGLRVVHLAGAELDGSTALHASVFQPLATSAREIRIADEAVRSVLELAGVPPERLQLALAPTGGVLAAV